MKKGLLTKAITKFIFGVVFVGAVLFISAGTFDYPQGWLFMTVLFVPMFIAGIVMFIKDPNLLESRLNAKEQQMEQKKVIALSGLMFLLGFVICGLDFRYKWFVLPNIVVICAAIIFLAAYIMYGEVLRENSFLSRTIQVQENQTVVDTGFL